jgi:hypothetical protein
LKVIWLLASTVAHGGRPFWARGGTQQINSRGEDRETCAYRTLSVETTSLDRRTTTSRISTPFLTERILVLCVVEVQPGHVASDASVIVTARICQGVLPTSFDTPSVLTSPASTMT